MIRIKALLLALVACTALLAQPADSQKVITRSTMLGFGRTNILDTYLSAEHFKGNGISFVTTIERQRPEKRWSTLMEHEANLSTIKDRAKTQKELEGAYNFYWGKLYSWQLFDNSLKLQAGGLVNASLGVIYNTSNGNNPAQARVHLNIMPTGVATYKFNLWNKPFTARYEVSLPLCGIMFSPNYGQSYYEIFSLGNYDHNVVRMAPDADPRRPPVEVGSLTYRLLRQYAAGQGQQPAPACLYPSPADRIHQTILDCDLRSK